MVTRPDAAACHSKDDNEARASRSSMRVDVEGRGINRGAARDDQIIAGTPGTRRNTFPGSELACVRDASSETST